MSDILDLAGLTDDEYRELIIAEIRGDDSARAALEDDLSAWRAGLVEITQGVEAQFTTRRAAAAAFKIECRDRGPVGKGDWFAYEADHNAWRARAGYFKKLVVSKLSEVKDLIRDAGGVGGPFAYEVAFATLNKKLDAILDHLGIVR